MDNNFKYVLLIILSILTACNSENEQGPPVQIKFGEMIEITVSVCDFITDRANGTRAVDFEDTTTFENGDRIGITILDEGGDFLANNIPYIFNNGNWIFDNGNSEKKEICFYDNKANTYIAYYPYSSEADNMKNINELKDKYVPQMDQSTKDAYRRSDLLVWTHTGNPLKLLNIQFKHAYSSILLVPQSKVNTGGYDIVYTVDVVKDVFFQINKNFHYPFAAPDGSYRLIIPSNSSISPRWFYTYMGEILGGTIASLCLTENSRYELSVVCDRGTYSLDDAAYGDFYCKDENGNAYLIPNEAVLLPDGTNCFGIVVSPYSPSDPLLQQEHPSCTHGLVLALSDASKGTVWSYSYENISNWLSELPENPYLINNLYWIDCGYAATKALEGYNMSAIVQLDENKKVLPVEHINTYSRINTPPESSSGWYFPSFMELLMYIRIDNCNAQIKKVQGAMLIEQDYWTSSEFDGNDGISAMSISCQDSWMDCNESEKRDNSYKVRPILAF